MSVVNGQSADLRDSSTGELLKQLSEKSSELVRQELELAKAELSEKGKQAGKGAGILGAAGVVGLLAAGALTAFLILVVGMMLPSTRVEDEKMGPLADQVKEKASEMGEEAVERGKDVAGQVAEQAKETAKEAGSEQAEEMKSSGQDRAQEVRPVTS